MTNPPYIPIRPAVRADIDAMLAIEERVFPGDRLTRRDFRHAIGSSSLLTWVAGSPGAVVGYVFVETRRNARVGHVSSVAVAPEAAGQGVGRRLVEAAETDASARGCNRLRLEVRADNARAIAMYGRAGYRETGREPDYYEDGTEAVRLEKNLGGPDV